MFELKKHYYIIVITDATTFNQTQMIMINKIYYLIKDIFINKKK